MTSIAEKYAQQYQPNGEVSLADLIQAAVDEAQLVPVGMKVSVDVSTGEHDSFNRVFATVTGQQDDGQGGVILLCEEESRNFGQSVAVVGEPVAIVGEPIAILRREIGEDTWFDWTPVKPGSDEHQRLRAAGEMDYCEVYQRYTQSIPASKLSSLRARLEQAEKERDELLALLKEAYGYTPEATDLLPERIKAVIAKIEGEHKP